MLLFAALMVIFVIVTVDQFGTKQYVSDNVPGLPPVFVLTAILVPFCAAFVVGFWLLFLDSFKREGSEEAEMAAPPLLLPERERLRERLSRWGRAHRPRWPRRAD
jgi:hypothetical protein